MLKSLMKTKCKDKRLKTMFQVYGFEWVRLLTVGLNGSISGSDAILGGSIFHWTMGRRRSEYLW